MVKFQYLLIASQNLIRALKLKQTQTHPLYGPGCETFTREGSRGSEEPIMAKIIQWNMPGLRTNYSDLEILIGTFRPVAFCLRELLIPESYVFQNRQYTFIKTLLDIDTLLNSTQLFIGV
jgi:hypothetical protein